MSGWLLILALLLLGGVLSTLGDRLGSKVGKARLSLLGMRPRRTAVLITVLTGSLISGISLGLMLLVSDRLRTGLFELDQIERRLKESREALNRSQVLLESSRTAVRTAEQGRLRPNDKVVMIGFGAGLTWAAAAVTWGQPRLVSRAQRTAQRLRYGVSGVRSRLLRELRKLRQGQGAE